MDKYIILVMSACIAHIYTIEFTKSATAQLIKSIVHPASRKKNMDLVADKSGCAQTDCRSQKVTFSTKTEPKLVEKEKFIKQIALELKQEINTNPQNKIILVAEPELMGELNKLLPKQMYVHVKYRINKNLTSFNVEEVTNILKKEIKPILMNLDN